MSTFFAGFAAVAWVRASVIDGFLRVLHEEGSLPSTISGAIPVPAGFGFPQGTVFPYDLFLYAPGVRLNETFGNAIAFDLRMTGRVRIVGNTTILDRRVILGTTVTAQPVVLLDQGGVRVRIAVQNVAVTALNLGAADGMPLPAALTNVLQSNAMLQALTLALQGALAMVQTMVPPLMVPVVADFGIGTKVSVTRLVHRVLDGALAVAIDVGPGTAKISTNGSISAITNFLSQSSMATAVNPKLLPLFRDRIRPVIAEKAAKKGVELDDLWITAEKDNLRVGGHATKDSFGVSFGGSFSLRAKPMLGTPEKVEIVEEEDGSYTTLITPESDNIWVKVYDVDVDEELPWWVYVGVAAMSVLALPAAPVIIMTVTSMIESIRNNAIHNIQNSASAVGSEPTQTIALPGTSTMADFRVSHLAFGSQGIRGRLWVGWPGWAAYIHGPKSTATHLRTFTLSRAPMLWHAQDPLVRVRWELRRLDKPSSVIVNELPYTDPNSRQLTFTWPQLTTDQEALFAVSCRVYRQLPWNLGGPEELMNQTIKMTFKDRLDRSHPYVQWTHDVYIPQVKYHPVDWSLIDGPNWMIDSTGTKLKEIVGYRHVVRTSDIHRTAIPGRCKFADSLRLRGPKKLVYMDELPFPLNELSLADSKNRKRLCDYCFYGGPDKKALLI